MYPSSGTTIRGDLTLKVEEAASLDTFHIATRVMPQIGVDIKSGTYPKLSITGAQLMKAGSTLRAPDGSYGEVTRNWGTDTYDTQDRGLEERVDDADAKDVGRFFNLESTKARLVRRNMALDHEIRVAAQIFSATNFGAGTNSAVAYTEGNIATIDAPQDIMAAIERVNDNGVEANTIVIDSLVLNRLRRSTLLKAFVVGSLGEGAKVNASTLQAAFADHGITQVLVGRARYDSAKTGQSTKSITRIWGTTYIWVGAVNAGAGGVEDIMSGGAGYTLVWNKEGGLWVSETYRDDKRRSNFVRVRQHTSEKVVDGTAGTLITTQWS